MFLKNLELFLLIVEKGGLSAAGREVGLSPASVSERLATLETYYGATLLNRTTRAISLTDEGKLLVEGAAGYWPKPASCTAAFAPAPKPSAGRFA